ncbi:hypothetical protein [Streptomyces bugieae]|uniref:Adhesin domain-containing protein n=1 Tax=Streptomyces bugieae TaxID=3098223 RepID=A0ABU7NZ78_9ACTN|nr:hypothetical protein [Streptomyces sp. DSM 41528]
MPHRHHDRTRLPRRTLAAAAAAVVGVCGIAACGLLPGKTFEDDAVVSKRITAVRLDTHSGGVTVRGGKNGDAVSLHRSVEYHGDRPQGATHRVEDGVLVLGGCGDECSVTYTIDLTPARPQHVRAKTSNGSVTVRMPKGSYDISADTSNGAKHIGLADDPEGRYRLILSTSNGDITAKAA